MRVITKTRCLMIPFYSRDIYTVNEGVEEICELRFCGYRSLKRVNMVRGIKRIKDRAFCRCTRLKELEIHEGIEEIGSEIFVGTAIETITLPLRYLLKFHPRAFASTILAHDVYEDIRPPISTLKTLRLKMTYHATPSISFPKITEKDNGQLVRFVEEQQARYLRKEVLISRNVYYSLFVLKIMNIFVYNLDRCNTKKVGEISKRVFAYWFRGPWCKDMFPIRGVRAFRHWTRDIVVHSAAAKNAAARGFSYKFAKWDRVRIMYRGKWYKGTVRNYKPWEAVPFHVHCDGDQFGVITLVKSRARIQKLNGNGSDEPRPETDDSTSPSRKRPVGVCCDAMKKKRSRGSG